MEWTERRNASSRKTRHFIQILSTDSESFASSLCVAFKFLNLHNEAHQPSTKIQQNFADRSSTKPRNSTKRCYGSTKCLLAGRILNTAQSASQGCRSCCLSDPEFDAIAKSAYSIYGSESEFHRYFPLQI